MELMVRLGEEANVAGNWLIGIDIHQSAFFFFLFKIVILLKFYRYCLFVMVSAETLFLLIRNCSKRELQSQAKPSTDFTAMGRLSPLWATPLLF